VPRSAEVDVRVVGVDRENKKIALSLKQVEETRDA
jgi:ribosomal protein S1